MAFVEADLPDLQTLRFRVWRVSKPMSTIAYESQYRPDGTLAHRVRAALADGEVPPRLGLKGTAPIDASPESLVARAVRAALAVIFREWGM